MRSSLLPLYLLANTATLFSTECAKPQDTPPPAKRVSVRHIDPQGIGYTQGYTSFNLFAALGDPSHFWIPFVDVRAHIFDHGQPAANGGFGVRFPTSSWVFGANGYFDYRKTRHQQYTQGGLGFEALHSRFDIRLNGYLPFGKKDSDPFGAQFSHFAGHNAILRAKYEFAFPGANLEIGGHLRRAENGTLYLAGGGYYFARHGKHAGGVQARASATFYDILQLEVNGSYDPVFRWIGQGQVGLSFAFGPKCAPCPPRCSKTPILWEKTYQRVERQEIIVLDQTHKDIVATNPLTGSPYTFWFVNNLSSSSGTAESPFPNILTAASASEEGDILYIFPGSGAEYDTYTTGMTLKNGQNLWGSATEQFLSTPQGLIEIPAQTTAMPKLTGGSDSATTGTVILADFNEVSGIYFTGSGSDGSGIYGNGCHSPTIRNNFFVGEFGGSSTGACFLDSALGITNIENNVLEVEGTSPNGIQVYGAAGTVNLTNNRVSSSEDRFYAIWINTLSDGANCTVLNNQISCLGTIGLTGIAHFPQNNETITLSHNTIVCSGTDSRGIQVNHDSDSSSSTYSSNTISCLGSDSYGFICLHYNDSSATSFSNNTILMSSIGLGIAEEFFNISTIGDAQSEYSQNTITAPSGSNHIQISTNGSNSLCTTLNNNTCRRTDSDPGTIVLNNIHFPTSHLYLLPSSGNIPATFTERDVTDVSTCPE